MREFVTSAYTLRTSASKEFDKTATLFTKDFGKIEVRVVSGRKPLSKFAMHLEPLRRVTVRLTKKRGFTLTDVLTDSICSHIKNGSAVWENTIRSFALIHSLTPREIKDEEIWNLLECVGRGGIINPRDILVSLGYDITHAVCGGCGAPFIAGFDVRNQEFMCIECARGYQESRIIIV